MDEVTDERNRRLRVYVNRSRKDKIPKEAPKDVWRNFHRQWRPAELTARQLAIEVWRGNSIAHLHDGWKAKDRWQEAWYIALDFDTEDERSTLDYLSQQELIKVYASFAHTTPSHTPEAPRARVVWVFDEPITDLDEYTELYKALLWQHPWADQSTKDVARFFYGSPKCDVWANWSCLYTPVRDHILSVYQEERPEPDPEPITIKVEHDELPPKFLEVAAQKLIDNILTAGDGEKHYTLNRIAYTFGGYVASGYYSESEVDSWLRGAVQKLPNVKSKQQAYQTIQDGLKAGQGNPLYFEVKQAPSLGDRL